MPWYAYLYLLALAAVASGAFVDGVGKRDERLDSLLGLISTAVLGLGVVFYYRGNGAGVAFAAAFSLAVGYEAKGSIRELRESYPAGFTWSEWVGLGVAAVVFGPAVVLGVAAIWIQGNV